MQAGASAPVDERGKTSRPEGAQRARNIPQSRGTTQPELNDQLSEIWRMLNGMIQKADSFCCPGTTAVGESEAQYFVNAPAERASHIHE